MRPNCSRKLDCNSIIFYVRYGPGFGGQFYVGPAALTIECVCVCLSVPNCACLCESEVGISSWCLSFSCNFYVHSIRYRYAKCYVKLIYKQNCGQGGA